MPAVGAAGIGGGRSEKKMSALSSSGVAKRLFGIGLGTALCVAAATAGAAQMQRLHIGTAHRALFDVTFDGEAAYAVGAGGRVMRSADAGATWAFEPTDTKLALLAIAVRDGQGVAVGQMGITARRDADGQWVSAPSGSEQRLMGVDLDAASVAVAVGSFGAIVRSEDAGKSWRPVKVDWSTLVDGGFEPHLYAVQALGGGRFLAVGESGLILRSDDEGASWSRVRQGEASLFALDVRGDGLGFAVGQSGTVLRTADGGASWDKLDVPTDANLLGVSVTVDGLVVVPGMREMLVSEDNGGNWEQVRAGDVARVWYLAAGQAPGDGGVIVVGQAERIARIGSNR